MYERYVNLYQTKPAEQFPVLDSVPIVAVLSTENPGWYFEE